MLVVSGQEGDPHGHLLGRSEHDVDLVVINGIPRYGASQTMRRLLDPAGGEAETATVAGRQRLLNLKQPTSDPTVAKLGLSEAEALLADGLSRLPELAKLLTATPALDLLDSRSDGSGAVFLVLDHDDLAGVDQRPHLPDAHGHYTAEPTPEMLAAGTPLGDLLEPLALDPLTVYDDDRFLELLARERNLPAQIAADITNLY